MQARAFSGCTASCSSPVLPDRHVVSLRHGFRPAPPSRSSQRLHAVVMAASRSCHPASEHAADGHAQQTWQLRLAGGLAAAAMSACIAVSPAAAAEPFLTATGAQLLPTLAAPLLPCWPVARPGYDAVLCCLHRLLGHRDADVLFRSFFDTCRGAGVVERPGGGAVPVAGREGGPGALVGLHAQQMLRAVHRHTSWIRCLDRVWGKAGCLGATSFQGLMACWEGGRHARASGFA